MTSESTHEPTEFIAFLESTKREYGVETGKPLDVAVLGVVLGLGPALDGQQYHVK